MTNCTRMLIIPLLAAVWTCAKYEHPGAHAPYAVSTDHREHIGNSMEHSIELHYSPADSAKVIGTIPPFTIYSAWPVVFKRKTSSQVENSDTNTEGQKWVLARSGGEAGYVLNKERYGRSDGAGFVFLYEDCECIGPEKRETPRGSILEIESSWRCRELSGSYPGSTGNYLYLKLRSHAYIRLPDVVTQWTQRADWLTKPDGTPCYLYPDGVPIAAYTNVYGAPKYLRSDMQFTSIGRYNLSKIVWQSGGGGVAAKAEYYYAGYADGSSDIVSVSSSNIANPSLAADTGKRELLIYCIRRGMDVNAMNQYGETLLHRYFDWEWVRTALLEHGADSFQRNRDGETPFGAYFSARRSQMRDPSSEAKAYYRDFFLTGTIIAAAGADIHEKPEPSAHAARAQAGANVLIVDRGPMTNINGEDGRWARIYHKGRTGFVFDTALSNTPATSAFIKGIIQPLPRIWVLAQPYEDGTVRTIRYWKDFLEFPLIVSNAPNGIFLRYRTTPHFDEVQQIVYAEQRSGAAYSFRLFTKDVDSIAPPRVWDCLYDAESKEMIVRMYPATSSNRTLIFGDAVADALQETMVWANRRSIMSKKADYRFIRLEMPRDDMSPEPDEKDGDGDAVLRLMRE